MDIGSTSLRVWWQRGHPAVGFWGSFQAQSPRLEFTSPVDLRWPGVALAATNAVTTPAAAVSHAPKASVFRSADLWVMPATWNLWERQEIRSVVARKASSVSRGSARSLSLSVASRERHATKRVVLHVARKDLIASTGLANSRSQYVAEWVITVRSVRRGDFPAARMAWSASMGPVSQFAPNWVARAA